MFFSPMLWIVIWIVGCNKPDPETYLIPKGFEGHINIIFNQPRGEAPLFVDGRRIYNIPAGGILLTQFSETFGYYDHKYYYVDSNGKKTAIPVFTDDYNKDGTIHWQITDSNSVGIFGDGTAGVYGTLNIKYQDFLVSSFNKRQSFYSDSVKENFYKRIKFAIKKDF
jgi:hypothetical protein